MSVIASIFFVLMTGSCEPLWIKNKINPRVWVAQEEAYVCIRSANDSIPGIIEAINAWDSAIGKWKHLIPVVGVSDMCDYTIEEVEADESVSITALASTTLFGRKIKLYKNRYEIDVVAVVLHELGHVLGARHIEGTLMAPVISYGTYKCPDAATVAQVALANAIDPSLFSWCKS